MKRNAKNWKKYKEVCKEIWNEDQTCRDCGRYLANPKSHNFHHIKGRLTDELGLLKENILLVCFKCHSKREGQDVKGSEWLDY